MGIVCFMECAPAHTPALRQKIGGEPEGQIEIGLMETVQTNTC
jgi:hypothetical protein